MDAAIDAGIKSGIQIISETTCPVCGEIIQRLTSMQLFKKEWKIPVSFECTCVREEQKRRRQYFAEFERENLRSRINAGLCRAGLQAVEQSDYFSEWSANYNQRVLKEAIAFCDDASFRLANGIGLILIGPCRCGKSYCLQAIAQRLMADGYIVSYAKMMTYLSAFRNCYDEDSPQTEQSLLDMLLKADCVIIDELGLGRLTTWGLAKFFDLIDTLRSKNKSILCATNYSTTQLNEIFVDPVLGEDRITPRILETSQTLFVDVSPFTNKLRAKTEQTVCSRNASFQSSIKEGAIC